MTPLASPVLVTGATGNTGQAVVQALARRGVPVRAMVRAEADRGKLPAGVEVAIADFDDPASIAAVAAAALTEAGRDGATYTVTGPAPITHADMAAALTSALGRDITFVDVPPDAFAESLQGILPPWQIQGLLEDYAHYRRGEAASVSPAVAEITGRPATDVAHFARDYAQAFTA